MQKGVFKISLILFFTLNLFGCFSNNKSSPSYVIVAIDEFGAGTVSCPEYLEKGEGGFFILCNDFVRMTNAYSPSLQSPAAIASLLTGEYPINHGLRHADSFLSFDYQTVAQMLLPKKYKTAFFSEGDPIKSYQGLTRGFQHFYDFSTTAEAQTLKDLFASLTKFIIKNERPTFSVAYISTLRKMLEGERSTDALENELNMLFYQLKKHEKWHNTHIIVVGLRGTLLQTKEDPWPIVNLSERNIKVEAFFKPATKPRDRELSYQIDANISLADLGRTFIRLIDKGSKNKTEDLNFPELTTTKSIHTYFTDKNETAVKVRPMLIESAWSDWKYGYSPIYMILDDQYRVYLNKEIRVFNTLLNRQLTQNDEQLPNERKYFYLTMASRLDSDGKDQFKNSDIQKFALGYQIWGKKDYKYPEILTDLESLILEEENQSEIINWMAKLAVLHVDCTTLQTLAQKYKNKKWDLTAKQCLKKNIKFTNAYRGGCLGVFFKHVKTWPKQCQNDLLYHAWKLIYFDQSESQLKIFRTYYLQNLVKEQRIQDDWRTFLSSSVTYEVSMEPTDFELYYLQLTPRQKTLIDQAKLLF